MQRSRYLLNKFLLAVITLIITIIFNFFLFRILPGDPARALVGVGRMKPETMEKIREQFGLDKPIWINIDELKVGDFRSGFDSQFTAYIRNLLKGNLGVSFANRLEVSAILADRVWKTVILLFTGEIVAFMLGSILGIIGSWRRGSKLDISILIWGLFTWSIPTFFFGIILVILARGHLPTGMMVTVGLKPENGLAYWADVAKHLILPTITMGIGFTSSYMMVMRSSIVEVLSEDYILCAKAKGLSTFEIFRDHALKNAMLPMVTLIALGLGYTVGGAIQVETVFSWPGVGRLIFDSVGKQDYPVLQGTFLLLAVSVIGANFLADFVYTLLDPRVQLQKPTLAHHAQKISLRLFKRLLGISTIISGIPKAIARLRLSIPRLLSTLLRSSVKIGSGLWNGLRVFGRTLQRKPMAVLGLLMLAIVIILAIFAPLISPYSIKEMSTLKVSTGEILTPPDKNHLLGTDDAGKDVLSQLIYGARISLIVGFTASFMSLIIGTIIGMISGYFGGKIDSFFMRLVDFLLVIPTLPLMLIIITFWGRGLDKIIFVIGILYWTYMARLVRSQVISIKERHYILRAKEIGASDFRIIFKHIFPQVVPLIIAQGILDTSTAIIAESSLAFLGLGDPTKISWGMMLNFAFARAISRGAWWFLLPPGLAIVWVSLSLVLIGTALEEVFNPRLKTHHLFDARKMLSMLRVSQTSPTSIEATEKI
jgi:ABC-type dipeptide/oligopeptide/nickel transport system permease subunit